jgi:hypothetical protein
MGPEADGRVTSFGEFGAATVVFTPRFVRHQLDTALRALLPRTDWSPEFGADLASAWADTPSLLVEDGSERGFAVTIHAELDAEVLG